MHRLTPLALLLATILLPAGLSAAVLPAGQPLTAAMARELVAAALPEAPPGRRWHVQLVTRGFPLPNQARADGRMEIETLDVRQPSGSFDASLRVTLEGGQAGIISLRGRAEAQAEVAILARPVARGERIARDDLASRWLPAARLDGDALVDAADLVGQEAARRLPAGRVVRAADIRAPRLVRKDEPVTLVYRRGGLDLVSGGTALDSGGEGDSIRVLNPSSNRALRGLVVGPRRVEVGPAAEGRS